MNNTQNYITVGGKYIWIALVLHDILWPLSKVVSPLKMILMKQNVFNFLITGKHFCRDSLPKNTFLE
jgi:hypothetical protein